MILDGSGVHHLNSGIYADTPGSTLFIFKKGKMNKLSIKSPASPYILGISVLCLIGLRLFFCLQFNHPGHGDFAHYYNLAVNLYEGRGLVVDYVWDYLVIYDSITHPPLYWMPLASVSMALFFKLTGASVWAGILLSIIVLFFIVAVIGLISRREFPDRGATRHAAAALLVAGLPVIFSYSIITDAVIYNVLWTTIGICMLGAFYDKRKPGYLYAFTLSAALVYYSRGDGLIMTGSAAVFFLLVFFRKGSDRKQLLVHGGANLLIYFLLIHPYSVFLKNAAGGGEGVGTLSLFFATSYNDLFMWGAADRLNLETWLAGGVSTAILDRFRAAFSFLSYMIKVSLGTILLAPMFGFLALRRPAGRSFYLPMMLHGLFLFGAYFFLLPYSGMGGSFNKSIIALFPLWSLAVFSETAGLVETLTRKLEANGDSFAKYVKGAGVSAYLLVMLFFTVLAVEKGFEMLDENSGIDRHWSQVAGILPEGTPVICSEPWECYYNTRYPSLITPGNDWETVFTVAETYGVSHVIIEKSSPGKRSRKFKKLGSVIPPCLEAVYESESMKIVEIPERDPRNLP